MSELNMVRQVSLIIIGMLNLSSLALFYIDKKRAQFKQKRISEKTLITSAFILGGLGALLSMVIFRHKTRQIKFRIIIPITALITLGAIYLILKI